MIWSGLTGAALLGWAAGAIINYLSDVLPRRRRLAAPFCRACGRPFPFPKGLLDYFFWPRRCPACGTARSRRTWIVEAVSLVCSVWLAFRMPTPVDYGLAWLLLVYLGAVTVIDLEHRLILHPVSLAGVALGLATGVRLHGTGPTLSGGLAGAGMMFGLFLLGILFGGLLGRLTGAAFAPGEALGFGDVALSGVAGLLLGWPGIVVGLFLTILLSGLVSLIVIVGALLLRRYRPGLALPYGPFIVASVAFLLFKP